MKHDILLREIDIIDFVMIKKVQLYNWSYMYTS